METGTGGCRKVPAFCRSSDHDDCRAVFFRQFFKNIGRALEEKLLPHGQDLISAVFKGSFAGFLRFRINDHGCSLPGATLCERLCFLHHFKADFLGPAVRQFKKYPYILIAHGLPP